MKIVSNTVQCKYDGNKETIRPLANFHKDVWGDLFLDYTPIDEVTRTKQLQEVEELCEEVRNDLFNVVCNPKDKLLLIDAIQRLGVAYHFEEEIEANLLTFLDNNHSKYDDLEFDSLQFRLLRKHGFHVSCGVFEKYKDEHGCFKECLKTAVQGLLNLYEASELRLHGENVLEEALAFSRTHLTTLASSLSSPLSEQINHALKRPLYKCTIRLESKYFQFSIYESNPSHHKALLRLAKLDFNLLQHLHKEELRDLIRWSRSMDFTRKFPFARDRVVEAYIWSLAIYHEPKYSIGRMILNKFIKLITVVDDMYDAYGTIDELEIFTEAILRWDRSCMDQLPDYMKLAYEILLDTFQGFEQVLADEGRSFAMHYLQKELQNLCQAYIEEARWCHQKYVPTYKEYMKNAIVSSTFYLILMATYQDGTKMATKDAIEWVYKNSKAIEASCIIATLMDDIGGHKFEQKRNHVASAVECYMSNFGVSEEEAYKELQHQVEEAWKDIREEIVRPTVVPMPLLTRILNMTRSLYDVYMNGEDGYTIVSGNMQAKVKTLLIDLAL